MWNNERHAALRAEGCSSRLANCIIAEGCDTFAQFCEKWTIQQMMRVPNFGPHCKQLVRELAQAKGIKLREATPAPLPILKRYRMVAYLQDRVIFERFLEHFAQVGGHIGNLVGDVDEIRVFDTDKCVLAYMAGGIFIGPKLAADYSEEELEEAMRDAT